MKRMIVFFVLSLVFFSCGGVEKPESTEVKVSSQEKILKLIESKQYSQAEKALIQEAKNNPENLETLSLLGKVYFLQKNYKKSLESYSKVLKLGQPKASTYFHIGENFQELKNYFSAIENYKKAVVLNPMLSEAYLKIGDIYLEWNKFEIASGWYDKAMVNDRKSASTYFHMANLQFEAAQYDKSIVLLNQSLEIDPLFKNSRILELQILNRQKKTAILLNKAALFINDFPKEADGYLFLGRFYLDQKEFPKSLANYKKAAEVAPEDPSTFNGLGNYYYELKNYAEALKYYTSALTLNPNYAPVYFNLALVNWKQKNYKTAIDNFTKAYELSLEFKESLLFSGVCAFSAGEEEKAINYFVDFYKKDAALFNKYLKSQEYGPIMGQAIQFYFKYNPREDSMHRAIYLCMMENPDKALIMLQKEENALAYFLAARLYFMKEKPQQKDFAKGKEYFLKYLGEENSSIQSILLDSSFDLLKGEDWFLKALEKTN